MPQLTPMMRKDIDKLIAQKADNVINALEQEISVDTDVIRDKLLKSRGVPKSSDELREEKRRLERQIEDVETSELPGLRALSNEYVRVDDDGDRELEALKIQQRIAYEAFRHQQAMELEAARNAQAERLSTIEANKTAIKNKAVEAEYPGALERIAAITITLPEVVKLEHQTEDEVNRKAESIEHNRARLIQLVRDAAVRAKQQLLQSEDAGQIEAILNVIPSVAEIINISEDPEGGLAGIVNRLAPDRPLSIAAPKFEIMRQDDGTLPAKATLDGVEVSIIYVDDDEEVGQ